jgi:hypothetical protein
MIWEEYEGDEKGVRYFWSVNLRGPIPVAVRSQAWVCGRSLTGIVGSNPTGGMDVCLL